MSGLELLQFTDTHLFGDAAGTLRGIATFETLQQLLRQAAPDIARADGLLVTGDVVQDDARGYELFRRAFSGLGKPVYCLPGNHDDPSAMQRALSSAPFQYGGIVDRGGWRLILLDSCVPGSAGGRLSATELQRLEDALGGAAGRLVLVCIHHQVLPMRSRWLDEVGLENAEEFWRVLRRHHGPVRGVVWGHVHQAADLQHEGIRLLATPSTCAQFLPCADDFALDVLPPAYRRLQLLPDGHIESEVVWLG
jgi:3',5'-cyclic-AMP phosphodiesterase